MAQKKKGGLGMGLDALLYDNSTPDSAGSPLMVNINDIEPSQNQPRKHFEQQALDELAESIARHGVIQPLIVRALADGGYQLVAGERRWRAARIAGLSEVPVVIRDIREPELLEVALVENLQREDLNPIEQAKGFQALMDLYDLTQEQAAQRVGKSRPAVANSVRLLLLPEQVLSLVEQGRLSAGHARALLALSDAVEITRAADKVIEKGLSVRDTERMVKFMIKKAAEKRPSRGKRDVYYDEVELAVSDALGRRAKISVAKSGKGTIQIEFFDRQDLEKLIKNFYNNE